MLKGQQGIYAYHCLQSWVGNDEEIRGWNDLIQALGPKDNGSRYVKNLGILFPYCVGKCA